MEPVKFLYAADLRLDKPLMLEEGSGISADQARDTAYEAVRWLVSCALSREADFVLLRGEIFDAYHSVKALLFLAEQAARLSDAGIPCCVFNEGPAPDPRWFPELPSGVKWFSRQSELEDSGVITCGGRNISLAPLLEPAPPPLLGTSPYGSSPAGAWLVTIPGAGGPVWKYEREFLEFNALHLERGGPGAVQAETEEVIHEKSALEKDFWDEAEFFKSGIDLRVGLLDALKERGLYKHILAADASLLANMTEADADSVLNEACAMAKIWLRKDEAETR